MERETEVENPVMHRGISLAVEKLITQATEKFKEQMLEISAKELIENLHADSYKEKPEVLQNLNIFFTHANSFRELETILELLQVRGLSNTLRKLNISATKVNAGSHPHFPMTKLPLSIKNLSGLISLDVSHHYLTTLEGIDQLSVLTSLDISSNQLTTLSGIKQLSALVLLDASSNGLTTVEDIRHTPKLMLLDVHSNNLTMLANIEQLLALHWLDVSRNHLETLAGVEGLKNLTLLYARSNGLTTLRHIKDLKSLQSLDVSFNPLNTLRDIQQLKALVSLKAIKINLTTLADIESLTMLTYLDVKSNQLTTLAGIESLTALKHLVIMNNQLTRLPIILGNFTSLEPFYVHNNPLQEGTPTTVAELKTQFFNLQQAYLRLIKIAELVNGHVPKLPHVINQIIIQYGNDIGDSIRFLLDSLSQKELEVLRKSISIASIKNKDAQTQKKEGDLKVILNLYKTIENNDFETFQQYLSQAKRLSINLNAKIDDANYTLLHAAAFNNASGFTRILLENGANPNEIDGNGYTPVATAAVRGNHKILTVYQHHAPQPGQSLFLAIMPETWEDAIRKYENIKDQNSNNAELNYKEVREILDTVLKSLKLEVLKKSISTSLIKSKDVQAKEKEDELKVISDLRKAINNIMALPLD